MSFKFFNFGFELLYGLVHVILEVSFDCADFVFNDWTGSLLAVFDKFILDIFVLLAYTFSEEDFEFLDFLPDCFGFELGNTLLSELFVRLVYYVFFVGLFSFV